MNANDHAIRVGSHTHCENGRVTKKAMESLVNDPSIQQGIRYVYHINDHRANDASV